MKCNWASVPNIPSQTVLFRAEAANDTTDIISNTSTNARIHGKFSISLPTCTSSNCYSEQQDSGTNLTWSQSAGNSTTIPSVILEYTTDDIAGTPTWSRLNGMSTSGISNDTNYNASDSSPQGPWLIPESVVSDNVRIRVFSKDENGTGFLDSAGTAGPFSVKAKFRMITPNTLVTWKVGETNRDIQWAFKGPTTGMNVRLYYCTDSTTCASPTQITTSAISAAYSTGCSVPTGLNANENGGCFHWANATTGGVADVRSKTVRIYIHDNEDLCTATDGSSVACVGSRPTEDDIVDADFYIIPNIVLINPIPASDGAVKLDAETSNASTQVQFSVRGSWANPADAKVDILYSDNNGLSYDYSIADDYLMNTPSAPTGSSATTYTKSWTTPIIISDTSTSPATHYKIKIVDSETGYEFNEVPNQYYFDNVAKMDFSAGAPVSSSNWQVGSNYSISWSTKGGLNKVKLYYKTHGFGYQLIKQSGSEGGSPAPTPTDGGLGGTGEVDNASFVWKVPTVANIASNQARIQVLDADTGHVLRTVGDQSSLFDIVPKITNVLPGAGTGETIYAGTTQNIQWRTKGMNAVSNVTIKYSINGAAYVTIPDASGTPITSIPNGQNGTCALPSDVSGEIEGCYEYKVHFNLIGTNVKFLVMQYQDTGSIPDSTQISGNGVSANGFEVKKNLILIQPNGGESLLQNVAYDVKWLAYGNFTSDKIELHYSNTADFSSGVNAVMTGGNNNQNGTTCVLPDVDSGGVAGCYKWPLTGVGTAGGLYMRVRENAGSIPQAISANPWEIAGKLSLQNPNGTPNFYQVGNTIKVQWINNDLAGGRESVVDLEYSTNGFPNAACNPATGAGNCPICNTEVSGGACPSQNQGENLDNLDTSNLYNASACGGAGCWEFNWVIPDNIANTVAVRVTNHAEEPTPYNITAEDRSNANFKIVGVVGLTTLGSQDDTYKIKDANNAGAYPVAINWSRTGTAQGTLFNNFRIDYSQDASFNTYNVIDSDVTLAEAGCTGAATACSYSWEPDVTPFDHSAFISQLPIYYLRVMDPDQTDAKAVSVKKFQLAGSMHLTILNSGNEKYPIGTNKTITWTRGGNEIPTYFDNFIVEFDDDLNFGSPVQIASVNFTAANCPGSDTQCSISWPLSDTATWSQYMSTAPIYYLRVYDPNSHATDLTKTHETSGSNKFELRGDIALTAPLMGATDEIFKIATPVTINWTRAGNQLSTIFDTFAIQFSSTGSFTGEQTTIATLDFTNATGAKCEGADTACTYSWTPDAATYSSFISSTADYFFRVVETHNDDTAAPAQHQFELRGDIILDALPGNQIYKIGAGPTFTWTKKGNSQTPNFDYFTVQMSTGLSFPADSTTTTLGTVLMSTACPTNDSCSYSWNLSSSYSNKISLNKTYYLRVLDTNNDDTAASSGSFSSNKQFKIIGNLSLDALPTQGNPLQPSEPTTERYFVNTPVTFTWSRTGTDTSTTTPTSIYFDNFVLQYSLNSNFSSIAGTVGPKTFAEAICSGSDVSCEMTWTPGDSDPIVANKAYYMRVIDPDDPDTSSSSFDFTSNKQFQLSGYLDLTVLDGANATYTVGTYASGKGARITWTKKGKDNAAIFDNVNLAYSTDPNFASSTAIATVIINGSGNFCSNGDNCTYDWDIPTNAVLSSGAVYYVRVIDPNNTDSYNVSTYRFKLKGGLSNLAAGGTPWVVGASDKTLAWDTNGAMANVRISYSAKGDFSDAKFFKKNVSTSKLEYDSGASDFSSAQNILNNGNNNTIYTVVVPDAINNAVAIRVYDANDSSISTTLTGLKIYGSTALAALPGTQIYKIGDPVTIDWTRNGSATTTPNEFFNNFALQFSPDQDFDVPGNITTLATLDFTNATGAKCEGADTNCTYAWTPDAATYTQKIVSAKTYYLRVLDTDESLTVSSSKDFTSNKQFKLIGKLVLGALPTQTNPLHPTEPTTERYFVNTPVTFAWARNGNDTTTYSSNLFNNFRVQYSTDSSFPADARTVTIGTYTFGQASCSGAVTDCHIDWTPGETIPDLIVANKEHYLRVLDADDSDTASSSFNFGSNKQFELAGALDLTVLDSADAIYKVGTYASGRGARITWTKKGINNDQIFRLVNIQYTNTTTDPNFTSPTNAGTSVVINSTGTVCDGSGNCTYDWDIPTNAALSTTAVYKFRVIDAQNSDSYNISTNKFKLRGDFSSLNAANTPWAVASEPTFSWTTTGPISNVRMSFSRLGTFSSDEKFFKVDPSNKLVYDSSASSFATAQNITGNANGSKSYTVIVPDAINNAVAIRVYDANDSSISTTLTGLKIYGSTALAALPGTQIYKIGDPVTIDWTRNGSATTTPNEFFNNFALQFSPDQDFDVPGNITTLATLDFTNATGAKCEGADTNCTYAWTPDAATYTQKIVSAKTYYLRVLDTDESLTVSSSKDFTSNKQFKLIGKLVLGALPTQTNPLHPTEPTTERYFVNTPVTFAWARNGNDTTTYSSNLFNNFRVQYSTDSSFPADARTVTIGTYTFGQASCSGAVTDCHIDWTPGETIPDLIVANKEHYLRVLDADDSDTASSSFNFGSNKQFELAGALDLTVLDSADAIYKVGTYASGRGARITWTKKGINNDQIFRLVNIQYTNTTTDPNFTSPTNAGTSVVINSTGTVCDGSGNCTYDWDIPTNAALSTTAVYKFRVIDAQNSDSYNISTNKFKLRGDFSSLNAANTPWAVASEPTFSWTTTGPISNVRMSFSRLGTFSSDEKFFKVDPSNKLVYDSSASSFATAQNITGNANGSKTYTVIVPDFITTDGAASFKIRVYDANDQGIAVDSSGFKVYGKFSLSEPGLSQNQKKKAGASTTVSWSINGNATVTKAKLEYTADGSSWSPIVQATITDANGITLINPSTTTSFNWTIPSVKSNNDFLAQVRIRSAASDNTPDSDSIGISANPFKISASISVSEPFNGQSPTWKVNDTGKVIKWATVPTDLNGASAGNGLVNVYYRKNAQDSWHQILTTAGESNDTQEGWSPIPNVVSNQTQVRVVDRADCANVDTDCDSSGDTAGTFDISGSIYFESAPNAPMGGEPWAVYKATPAQLQKTYSINWTSYGSDMSQVNIHAINAGLSQDVTLASGISSVQQVIDSNLGKYRSSWSWQIKDTGVAPVTPIGPDWRIQIVNSTSNTPAVSTLSEEFDILAGFYMSSHNSSTNTCEIGNSSKCQITWNTAGSVSDAILEYSTDGFAWFKVHGTPTLGSNPGSYNWSVPSDKTPSATIRYHVIDAVTGHTPAASDVTGDPNPPDGVSKLVASFPKDDIKWDASVPQYGGTALGGGQIMAVGQTAKVNYKYYGNISSIAVQYTLDQDNNPATFNDPVDMTISNPIPPSGGTGQFQYTFPDLLAGGADTTRMQFRILDGNAAVQDNLPANTENGVTGSFKLRGKILIDNPTLGTERWIAGDQASIQWTTTGSVTSVNIYYDVYNNDDSFVVTGTLAGGPFTSNANTQTTKTFTINTTNLTDLDSRPLYYKKIFVRVTDAQSEGGNPIHGNSSYTTLKAHKISGKLSLIEGSSSPQAGAKWPVGSSQTITWTTYGKVPLVDVYYSANGTFSDQVKINSSAVANNQGTNATGATTNLPWTPPVTLALTSTYKIRVVDTGNNTTPDAPTFVLDSSYSTNRDSGAFKIHGVIDNVVLTSPTGTTKHKSSDAATVTWDTTGDNLNSVDIEYRDVTGAYLAGAWQPIQLVHTNTGVNRGTKSWTIPETFRSSNVEIRVKPADGTTDGYDSSVALKVMPKITVTTPVAAEPLSIGTAYDIKWDIRGVTSSIGIRYKTDGNATTNNYPSGDPYEIKTAGAPLVLDGTNYTKTGTNAKFQWIDAGTGGVADTPTALARMMVYDPLDDPASGGDVYGVSANNAGNFEIRGFINANNFSYLGVTYTDDAEFEVYGATLNPNPAVINWNGGGTIPDAIIEFSTTYDGSDPTSFNAGRKCLDGTTASPCPTVPNWSGSSGTKTYDWHVPDVISRNTSPYYIRIKDPNNANVFDIFPRGASNGFKIKSKLDITSPDGGNELLVGNKSYNINWTNTGTVPTVALEYSGDNWRHEDTNNNNIMDPGEDTDLDGFLDRVLCVAGGTYPNCNAIANDGSFNGFGAEGSTNGPWKIADDGKLIPWNCNTLPDNDPTDANHPCKVQTAKVRVRDGGDLPVMNASASNFTARYVAKKWYLRNSVTGADLDSITMYENTIHKVRANGSFATPGIVSPYIIWSPAGTNYTIAFSKVGFTDYYDAAQTTTLTDQVTGATVDPIEPNHAMLDERQTVYLSDIVAHNDVINTSYQYTTSSGSTPDSITFKVWYTRDGLNVVTTTQAQLLVYNGETLLSNMNLTSATQNPAGSGVYTFTISNTGLQKSTNYDARNKIRLPTGTDLQGFTVVNIGQASDTQTTNANVAVITPIITTNIDGKISDVKNAISDVKNALGVTGTDTIVSKLNSVQQAIENKIGTDSQGRTLMKKMDDQTETINTAITDFTKKSDKAVFKMQDAIARSAVRLIIPQTTKVGTKETIRVGTEASVTPTIDIICPNGTAIVSGMSLTATATPGLYAADITFNANTYKCAVAKAVTIIANVTIPSKDSAEPPVTGTAVGSIFLVTSTTDDVLAAASSGMGAERAAKDAKEAVNKVAQALAGKGNVFESLDQLQASIERIPSSLESGEKGVSQMKSTLDEVADRIAGFVGREGYDMRTILKQEIGEGMKGVRNKVDRTLTAARVMKDIMERKVGRSDEPIIQSFYEIGSVKLRVVAVNPSPEKPQTIPIKIFLPKEIIPDDIINMGELKVGYDSEKSLYFAYSDGVELGAQETRVFEVHLEDVWKVKNEELDKLQTQSDRAFKHLEVTEFSQDAKAVVDSIHARLSDIKKKQEDETVSREIHIGIYRTNLNVMEGVKEDIRMLEKMLQRTGSPASIEFLKDTVFEKKDHIDRITAWKLIMAILGFLGLLGAGFYARWFLMIKAHRGAQASELLDPAADIDEHVDAVKPGSGAAEEIDISKILGQGQDKDKQKAG